MNLMLYNLDNCTKTSFESGIIVLEIENRYYFQKIIKSIKGVIFNPLEICIIDEEKLLDFSKKCDVIIDYIELDNSAKAIVNKLHNKIVDDVGSEIDINNDLADMVHTIIMKLDNLINLDINISFTESKSIKDFLQFLSFIPETAEDIMERLLDRIALVSELNLFRLIVLVNPKSYFSDENMIEIYRYALHKNIKLLVIENIHRIEKLEYERKIYVDEDLFDIYL